MKGALFNLNFKNSKNKKIKK